MADNNPTPDTQEQAVARRYRVNVSTTSKGLKSYDCTVELTGATMEQVLQESDALVEALDQRYPAQG